MRAETTEIPVVTGVCVCFVPIPQSMLCEARSCHFLIGCWWHNASGKCVCDWTGGSFRREPAVESLAWRSVAPLRYPSVLLHTLPQCTLGCASPPNIALTGNLEKHPPITSFIHLACCPVKSLAHVSEYTHGHARTRATRSCGHLQGFYNNCCLIITMLCGGWSSVQIYTQCNIWDLTSHMFSHCVRR